MNRQKRLAIILGTLIGAAVAAKATPYTVGANVQVTETGNTPAEAVWINSGTLGTWDVWAGITELNVNGVATNSFCIDPFQWSSSQQQQYTVTALGSAPFPTAGMGSAAALTISKLWAENYQQALGNAQIAAGLQIAIWETVAGNPGMPSFSLVAGQSDYGAAGMLAVAAADTSAVAPVSLVALANGTYQDYVVQNVPDAGTTLALLGLGLAALALVGRRSPAVVAIKD